MSPLCESLAFLQLRHLLLLSKDYMLHMHSDTFIVALLPRSHCRLNSHTGFILRNWRGFFNSASRPAKGG